jgi:hypothetical protein
VVYDALANSVLLECALRNANWFTLENEDIPNQSG